MARSRLHQILAAYLLSLHLLVAHAQVSPAIVYEPAPIVEYQFVNQVAAAAAGDRKTSDQPFQLCLTCRCCAASDPSSCLSMPCCFGIDCGLPNKPFGVCAFAPNSCSCSSCS
ncbi:hypothetical protein KSP40_PGU009562 [Platanthera guangdongensis]|uniref:DUF7866 domain-containing protein n=1 Tax=Platanthera guangdongensis TaxID=2320717 RepID=A0ABR2MC57_9ASPA